MSAVPDDFAQLKLLFVDAIQHDYEAIRPVVLGAQTITNRSEQVGLERTVLGDKVRRFVTQGMFDRVDQRTAPTARETHVFPAPVASHVLYLKQLYPPIHYREIVRIVERRFGYHTNHHTVKLFLDKHPIAVQLPLKITTFHQFEDAYRARWTVVRLVYEEWHVQSIAGCLKLSRKHVHHVLTAFERDGFAGLEDQRTRPVNHPQNQRTLPLMQEILDIQRERQRAGKFRVRGLLQKQNEGGKKPSVATVGRAMARNRKFHGAHPLGVLTNVLKRLMAKSSRSAISQHTTTTTGSLICALFASGMTRGCIR